MQPLQNCIGGVIVQDFLEFFYLKLHFQPDTMTDMKSQKKKVVANTKYGSETCI